MVIRRPMGDATTDQWVRRKNLRRPAKNLTSRFVQTATEPGKYFDGHGLFLRISDSGIKYWVQRIVVQGKRREIGIGSVDFVSLAEARVAAYENRKMAREGGNPLQARREAAAVMTFEEAARKVHEMHKPTWKNEKHAAQFLATLETYAFPTLGKIRAPDVSTADVLAVLTPIWLDKPETARRVRGRVSIVMKWCIAQGWRQDNPADAIDKALPKQPPKTGRRKALPYADVHAVLEAVTQSGAGLSTRLALELLILCASRSGEVRLARWEEFDLDAAVWTIPADRMKAQRPHRVPLSKRAVQVVKAAEGLDADLVFPGTKKGRPLSDMTLLKLVREQGFEVDVHGFRSSFRTWAQERTNFPREVAEAALAHLSGDAVERAYARSDLFEQRRKMMERWAAFVAEKPAQVVRIG